MRANARFVARVTATKFQVTRNTGYYLGLDFAHQRAAPATKWSKIAPCSYQMVFKNQAKLGNPIGPRGAKLGYPIGPGRKNLQKKFF